MSNAVLEPSVTETLQLAGAMVRQTFMKHEGYHKRQWNPLVSR